MTGPHAHGYTLRARYRPWSRGARDRSEGRSEGEACAGDFWRDALEGKTLAEALPSDMHAVLEPLFRGALAGTAGAAEAWV